MSMETGTSSTTRTFVGGLEVHIDPALVVNIHVDPNEWPSREHVHDWSEVDHYGQPGTGFAMCGGCLGVGDLLP